MDEEPPARVSPLNHYPPQKLAATGKGECEPLLQAHTHRARTFDEDMLAAGVDKYKRYGVLVFHSWRATYGALLDSLGAGAKEVQELMRRATPMRTMQGYVQAQLERRQGPAIVSLTWCGVPEECPAAYREK